MYKFTQINKFAKSIFEDRKEAKMASRIMTAILEAKSPRISDIATEMGGSEAGDYKAIQRFIKKTNIKEPLTRLFNEDAEYIIGDPTEIKRPGAHNTEYVGVLRDGKTKGVWVLAIATPLRSRAIPFYFTTYSSATIEQEASSRNLEHAQAMREIKALIGNRPIIFDREFSYLDFLYKLWIEEINFVIRLQIGLHPPKFYYDSEKKKEIKLHITQNGRPKVYRNVYYKGIVPVNIIGIWQKGFNKPLWIMTSLEPEKGLELYQKRMKIETSFRDLKSLLHMDKIMNKSRIYFEKMLALLFITYAIALLIGEAIRDVYYGTMQPDAVHLLEIPASGMPPKWYSYSGLFVLLRRRINLPSHVLSKIIKIVLQFFKNLVYGKNVRSFVLS